MTTSEVNEQIETFFLNFVITGTCSSVARTILAPHDRILLILQNQSSALQVLTGQRIQYKGFLDCIKRLPHEQGILSFWRGNGTNVLRHFPSQGLVFSFNDFFKHFYHKTFGSEKDSPFISYLSGGCAGAVTSFILHPLEFCYVRLCLDMGSENGQKNVAREFNGLYDCFKKVVDADSLSGIYKGYTMGILANMLYRALYFGVFDNIKNIYAHHYASDDRRSKFKTPFITEWFFAQAVTTSAGMLTYPIESVSRRLMLDSGRKRALRAFTGNFTAFRDIYRKEGFLGFYKGGLLNCYRGIAGALIIVIYEEVLYYTNWKDVISPDVVIRSR